MKSWWVDEKLNTFKHFCVEYRYRIFFNVCCRNIQMGEHSILFPMSWTIWNPSVCRIGKALRSRIFDSAIVRSFLQKASFWIFLLRTDSWTQCFPLDFDLAELTSQRFALGTGYSLILGIISTHNAYFLEVITFGNHSQQRFVLSEGALFRRRWSRPVWGEGGRKKNGAWNWNWKSLLLNTFVAKTS